jgi:hypothetical protein
MAEIVVKLANGELAGKSAQTVAKELNACALAARKAEIGTQAWVDAHAKLDNAKKLQEDLSKQIKATTSASDLLKQAWNKLPGAGFFNQIAQSFGTAKQGVGGLISSMGVLKGAIAATGIGLLVLIVAQLVTWFSKTDEGATKLDGIFRAIGNTLDVLINRFLNVGKLLEAFTNPQKFWSELFTDIKEGIDLGQELAETFDNLDQARRDLELVDQQQANKLDELLLKSKNVGLSYKERLAILEEADAIELQNYKAKLKYSQDFAAAVDRETEFQKKQGTISDEQLDKQNQAAIKLLQVENERIKVEEKIANRREQLLDKEQAERDKAEKARAKAEEDRLKEEEKRAKAELDIRHNLEDLKVQAMIDGMDKEIAEIQLDTIRKIEALQGSADQIAEQRALLQLIEEERIQAIKDAAAAKAAETQKKNNEAQLAREKEQLEELNKLVKDQADFDRKIEQEKVEVAQDAYHTGFDLLAKQTKDEKEARRIKKLSTIADIGIRLEGELSANAFAASANPLNATTFGAAGAAQLLKSNLLSYLRAGISTARVLAFKKGGLLRGPKHERGGIPGVITSTGQPIEMEGDEFIFSGPAVRALGAKNLTRINDRFTKRFASGGPVNPFQDRAPISSGRASTAGRTSEDSRSDQMLMDLINAQDRRIDRIKVYVVASEVDKAIKVVAQIRDEADV